MTTIKKIKKTLTQKYVLFGLLAFFVFIGGLVLRGCSHAEHPHRSVYYIGRETPWQIELLGRERSLTAFTNDLLATIGAEHHIRFQWIETNPSDLLDGLDNESYDFILTAMLPNVINQKHYDFSALLFDLGPVLIVREDSPITSLKEMKGLPIGVPFGFATSFNPARVEGIGLSDLSLAYYNDMEKALEALINDQIDGVIMNVIPAYALAQGLYRGKLKIVTAPFNEEGLRLASLRNTGLEDIIKLVNESLKTMRSNGTYQSLIVKWNLIDPETQFWQPEKEK
jgi:ABC-type amino acid transport substrate-binding protein